MTVAQREAAARIRAFVEACDVGLHIGLALLAEDAFASQRFVSDLRLLLEPEDRAVPAPHPDSYVLRAMAERVDDPDSPALPAIQPSGVHHHLRYSAGYLLRLVADAIDAARTPAAPEPEAGETAVPASAGRAQRQGGVSSPPEGKAAPARGDVPAPQPDSERLDGVALIAAERRRQIEEKGYTAQHDDEHADSEILHVAGELVNYVDPGITLDPDDHWGIINRTDCKYPDDESAADLRLLVIAGALIAAEIDRRQRARAPAAPEPEPVAEERR